MNVKTRRIKAQHKTKRAKNLAKNTLVQMSYAYPVKSSKACSNFLHHNIPDPTLNDDARDDWQETMIAMRRSMRKVGDRPRTKKNHTTPMAKGVWALLDRVAKNWGVE